MYVPCSLFACIFHGAINRAIGNTLIHVQCGCNGLVMILPESVGSFLSTQCTSIMNVTANHACKL